MSQATIKQARHDNEQREDLRRLGKVIHSFGEGKAREAELKADYIDEIDCPVCFDEYSLWASWADNSVVFRDKDCACPIDPHLERGMIALHHNPPEPDWAPGFNDMCERADYEDNFGD